MALKHPQGERDRIIPARKPLRYDWVLFDADGTLFDYERAEQLALSQTFGQIGAAFSSDYLPTYRRINQALWAEMEQGHTTPAVLKVRRFELLLREAGVAHSPAEFSNLYLRALADNSELMAGAEAVLRGLDPACQAAIITNGLTAVQRRRVARSAIAHCFADIIISEEIGFAKPAVEFFETALARIGHPPKSQVLVVGDSWNSDILGAVNAGLDVCWFNPKRAVRPAVLNVTYEISQLRQLPAILAG